MAAASQPNGAHSLVRTFAENGVELCFANPGTSEMHFVAALDDAPTIRCVLGLFEGIVTGAADGYWRMVGKPAVTLLHLGPGLANGLANLHNARKARSGIVNVVGNHGLEHVRFESPLRGDVGGIAGTVSHWVRQSASSADVATDGAAALAATRDGADGRIATLILPADVAWQPGGPTAVAAGPVPPAAPLDAVPQAARMLKELGPRAMLFVGAGGSAGLAAQKNAVAIAAHTGCQLRAEFHNARMSGGRGSPHIERIPYMVEPAAACFSGVELLVLAGAAEPIAFFAYPGKPVQLKPAGAATITLAEPRHDVAAILAALADELGVTADAAEIPDAPPPAAPTGPLTPESLAAAVAVTLPEQAVVADESLTAGRSLPGAVRGAAPHDWLAGMGGAIGFGLPAAIGAAIGAPGRPVLAIEGDGSGMYSVQALWTMAREQLPIVVLILANRAYRSLQFEQKGVGANPDGRNSADLLALERPMLDWVALARGHGVPGRRAEDAEELVKALRDGFDSRAPFVIEAVL